MTIAGYSGKPLAVKLGIKAGFRVAVINAPADYLSTTLGAVPAEVSFADSLAGEADAFDLIHYFTRQAAELREQFPALKAAIKQQGSLWVSWPKGSSKVPTDLNENLIREIGLDGGLVDVKVAAVDAVWSALKFVYRLKDRA